MDVLARDQVRAGLRQANGDGPSNPLGGTCHDRDLVF